MRKSTRVVIVRDREAAGGGIFNYYRAVGKHLQVNHTLVDVGRPHGFYSGTSEGGRWALPTPLRLLRDWVHLAGRLFRFPDLVVLNPCMDPIEFRSLPRDAMNLLLAKLFGRRVLVFWRGWDNGVCGAAEFPGGNTGWISRIYRLANAHLVLAGAFRDDLRRWGFTRPVHLETTVVPDALLAPAEEAEARPEDGACRILYLSRIEVAKGVFELLEAFSLLEKRRPERFHLTIAGDGPDLRELRQKAEELGLQRIHFTGYVEGSEKLRCFAEAAVFCFPSYTEGMPNAVLEAMATGLPLVSSNAGGLQDILIEGVTGFLVKQDPSGAPRRRFSAEEMAERIERLADSADLRKRMGRHNAAYARERFAAAKVAARLEKIFREVCRRPEDAFLSDAA